MEFSIVTISAFVATLNEITKFTFKNVFDKDIKKFIPIFSIVYGVILGIAGYYSRVSDFGDTLFEAVFIGISSGAAATGFHQVGKQLAKTNDDKLDVEEIDVEDVVLDEETVEDEQEEETEAVEEVCDDEGETNTYTEDGSGD